MTADQYLRTILLREAVDAGPNSPLLGVQATLMPILWQWAGDNLLGVYPRAGGPGLPRYSLGFRLARIS